MLSYRGRFAPSPTGPLHAGSVVSALASWLDARAHQGVWLVRIEDVDQTRCEPSLGWHILSQLHALGLDSDEPVLWQSAQGVAYAQALQRLHAQAVVYPCACSRQKISRHWQSLEHNTSSWQPYPGWCRTQPITPTPPLPGPHNDHPVVAWRFQVPSGTLTWHDRRLGNQTQDLTTTVGDFLLHRTDGCWTYQLAVVVDDAHQGITHVVRGEDLADNTPRQLALQQALSLPSLQYWHGPLVLQSNGQKLSKQTGASPVDTGQPLQVLGQAAHILGLPPCHRHHSLDQALAFWVWAWWQKWGEQRNRSS